MFFKNDDLAIDRESLLVLPECCPTNWGRAQVVVAEFRATFAS
jgi:hypothetical protein